MERPAERRSVRWTLGVAAVAVLAVAAGPAVGGVSGVGRMSAVAGAGVAPAVTADVDPRLEADDGTTGVVVRATSEAGAAVAVTAAGGVVTRRLGLIDAVAADLPAGGVAAVAAAPGVLAVTADARVQVAGEWGGGEEDGGPASVHREAVRADTAERAGLQGSGVTVAVVDTGIAAVDDLEGRIVPVHDPVTGERTPCEDLSGEDHCRDSYGHGTFIAGLIAGTGRSSGGERRGIAPGARLLSVKVAGRDGSADVSTVLGAIQWVVSYKDDYGIDVLNLSLGTDGTQSYRVDPFNYAVQRAWAAGIAVVVAAGNLGPGPGTVSKPGDDPWVITAGAVDDRGTSGIGDDAVPAFSARGPARDGVAKPDVVAPGGRVVSLVSPSSTIERLQPAGLGSGYRRGSGTSMSAAVVSGAVALVREANPGWGPDRVKAALLQTARGAGSDDRRAVGHGLIDVAAAAGWGGSTAVNVGLDRSSGTGGLDPSRGSVRVQADTVVPVVVQGSLTAQLLLWDPLGMLVGDWDRGTWPSSSWVVHPHMRTTWHGHNWHGHNWHEAEWYGEPVAASYGRPGPGAAWYGAWE